MRPEVRGLGWLGRSGALPRRAAAVVERLTGFTQVLTRRPTITAALAHPDVRVPYRLRTEALGLGAFPLGLDGAAHRAARAVVGEVLDASAPAHVSGVAAAAQVARARMSAAGREVDLVAGVVDPALQAWVERWFGLPGAGDRLQALGRTTMHAVFLNPERPRQATDAPALHWACEQVAAEVPGLLDEMRGAPAGTVAAELLGHPATSDDDAVAHLVGLTVGPLALGSRALAGVLDHLLDDHELDGVDTTAAELLLGRALAERPPLPGVPRQCPHPVTVAAPRTTLTLPPGPFLAATEVAASRDHRPEELAFGLGPHACMGRDQVREVGTEVLRAVGGRTPRRRAGDGGRLVDAAPPDPVIGRWPFPGSLVVALDR